METVFILLGSNIGDRERLLRSAIDRMEQVEGFELIATSAIYSSEAQEMESESPPFLNQVVMADYQFTPKELLRALEQIETDLGRTDKGGMQPRTIDLDILLFGQKTIDQKQLTIPHPRLLERSFALVPLAQIDPEVVHPVTGRTIGSYITDELRSELEVYKDHVARGV